MANTSDIMAIKNIIEPANIVDFAINFARY